MTREVRSNFDLVQKLVRLRFRLEAESKVGTADHALARSLHERFGAGTPVASEVREAASALLIRYDLL